MTVDAQVQTAIANWAPRFIANGVDPNDFQRVTARIQSWDAWTREWSVCGSEHERLGEEATAAGNYESAAEHYFHAAMAYHFGKFLAVAFPDQLRVASERAVRCYEQALPWFEIPGERLAIEFEPETTMWGILRKPWHVIRPPIVILIPGLDSVKEELHSYSNDFLRRGMATLAIDGPGQGEMEFEHPMRADYEVAVRAAINTLERRSDVDAGRVGLMGVSLGGYYAPRSAAFEPRVRAAIALAGAYDVPAAFDQMPSLTQDAFIHRTGAATRAEALERLRPFSLTGVAPRITCPLLVIMGRRDRIIPPADAERLARDVAGPVDLWMFDDGNHVCNNITYLHRPQQADWMRQRL
ncbi:MAG TPA: alpha/beta fold hydrolase [Ktedonobacterales bacterium]